MELLELLETQLGLDMVVAIWEVEPLGLQDMGITMELEWVQALLQLLLEEPDMGTPEELAKELWGRWKMLWVEDRPAVKWGLEELELEQLELAMAQQAQLGREALGKLQLELVVSFKRPRTSSLATTTSRLCTHPPNT